MAHLSFPTVLPSNLSNPSLIDDFFIANKNLLGINPSSNFLVSQAINTTNTQSPNLLRDGFHFEPNYFSASKLLGTYDLWGIDIPVLIQNNPNASAKNLLIIIGQDPLRATNEKPKYLPKLFNNIPNKNNNSLKNYTIIGTPYAVAASHLNPQFKQTKAPYSSSNIYYKLIDDVFKQKNYDVYLTDVIKYYPSNGKDPDSSDLQLLAIEIIYLCNIYQSKNVVILAHGEIAQSAIQSIQSIPNIPNLPNLPNNVKKIIRTPHLSGGAGATKNWKNMIGSATNVDKINYIISQL